MTSKFNKEMYDKIKGKKNEPLSSIGQKRLRITDKDKELVERGSSTPTLDLEEGLVASPGVSIEEVARPSKKQKAAGKGKGKADASVWLDAGTAMDRATELFTPGEMREVTSVPSHEMVSRHVHKLVQVSHPHLVPVFVSICLTIFFFFFFLLTLYSSIGTGGDHAHHHSIPSE